MKKRKIYVDASLNKKDKTFNISIVDKKLNVYQIWKLPFTYFNQQAEELAILTAIFILLWLIQNKIVTPLSLLSSCVIRNKPITNTTSRISEVSIVLS